MILVKENDLVLSKDISNLQSFVNSYIENTIQTNWRQTKIKEDIQRFTNKLTMQLRDLLNCIKTDSNLRGILVLNRQNGYSERLASYYEIFENIYNDGYQLQVAANVVLDCIESTYERKLFIAYLFDKLYGHNEYENLEIINEFGKRLFIVDGNSMYTYNNSIIDLDYLFRMDYEGRIEEDEANNNKDNNINYDIILLRDDLKSPYIDDKRRERLNAYLKRLEDIKLEIDLSNESEMASRLDDNTSSEELPEEVQEDDFITDVLNGNLGGVLAPDSSKVNMSNPYDEKSNEISIKKKSSNLVGNSISIGGKLVIILEEDDEIVIRIKK